MFHGFLQDLNHAMLNDCFRQFFQRLLQKMFVEFLMRFFHGSLHKHFNGFFQKLLQGFVLENFLMTRLENRLSISSEISSDFFFNDFGNSSTSLFRNSSWDSFRSLYRYFATNFFMNFSMDNSRSKVCQDLVQFRGFSGDYCRFCFQ